jgi:hypothetical protein
VFPIPALVLILVYVDLSLYCFGNVSPFDGELGDAAVSVLLDVSAICLMYFELIA